MRRRAVWLLAACLAVAALGMAWLLSGPDLTVEEGSAAADGRALTYVVRNRALSPLAVGTDPWASLSRREGEEWLDTGIGQELHEDGGLSIGALGRRTFSLPLEAPLEPGTYRLEVEGQRDGKKVLLEAVFTEP